MYTIKIQNLKCGGCANTVTRGINSIKGVSDVSVSVETSEISFNITTADLLGSVKQKLISLGYPEISDSNSTILKAKSFVSCATGRVLPKSN